MKRIFAFTVALLIAINAHAHCYSTPHTLGANAKPYAMGEHGYFNAQYSSTTSKALRTQNCIHFNFDQTTPLSTPAAVYQAYTKYLILHPNKRLRLEGHTDRRGPYAYNAELGRKRAAAVANEFTHRGVDSSQIELVSFSHLRLLEEQDNEQAHALNRRVEIKLCSG